MRMILDERHTHTHTHTEVRLKVLTALTAAAPGSDVQTPVVISRALLPLHSVAAPFSVSLSLSWLHSTRSPCLACSSLPSLTLQLSSSLLWSPLLSLSVCHFESTDAQTLLTLLLKFPERGGETWETDCRNKSYHLHAAHTYVPTDF